MREGLTKLEPVEVQIRRVGDGMFQIARYRDGADFVFDDFNVADIPEAVVANQVEASPAQA